MNHQKPVWRNPRGLLSKSLNHTIATDDAESSSSESDGSRDSRLSSLDASSDSSDSDTDLETFYHSQPTDHYNDKPCSRSKLRPANLNHTMITDNHRSRDTGQSPLDAADSDTALPYNSKTMDQQINELLKKPVWRDPPGLDVATDTGLLGSAGHSMTSPIIIDPSDSSVDVDLSLVDSFPEVCRGFKKTLHGALASMRANPQCSKIRKTTIPRRCLGRMSPKSKDDLIMGMILAGNHLQRKVDRIPERRVRAHRGTNAVKRGVSERSRSKIAIPQVQDRATCSICLEDLIQQVTECGHAFCKGCLSKWGEISETCPTCRQPMGGSYGLFLSY